MPEARSPSPNPEKDQPTAILEWWHRVEFFIPFDLTGSVVDEHRDSQWKLRWSTKDDPLGQKGESLSTLQIPEGQKLSGFALYLGVFDKSEINSVCASSLPQAPRSEATATEEEERTDLDGQTCFVKIKLDEHGQPNLSQLAVSTLPWALGKLLHEGPDSLDDTSYQDAMSTLQTRLFNFQADRISKRAPDSPYHPLSEEDVRSLVALFHDWARFAPSKDPIALLEIIAHEADEKAPPADEVLQSATHEPEDSAAPSQEDEEEDVEQIEPEITILNSFFIKDLERAIADAKTGKLPSTLFTYLADIPTDRRIDLESSAGAAAILHTLHPKRINKGHWLDEPAHRMSLLQQFAINTAFDLLEKEGLFSVNGPPGTGKTTLLRDMIAENVVRRGRILAGLGSVDEAFEGKIRVEFPGDQDPTTIRQLSKKLTGFEMVVVSSNNAAVENISLDLPRKSSVGKSWQSAQYLNGVILKMVSQTSKGNFPAPKPDEVPWGLISCALGNSNNRRRFRERFAFWPDKKNGPARKWASDAVAPQTIWDWTRAYSGPSFRDAANAFRQLDRRVSDLVESRQSYVDLLVEQRAEELRLASYTSIIAEAEQRHRQESEAAAQLQEQEALLRKQLEYLKETADLIDRISPEERESGGYSAEKTSNAKSQLDIRRHIFSLTESLNQTRHAQEEATKAIDAGMASSRQVRKQIELIETRLAELREMIGEANVPVLPDDPMDETVQIKGSWHEVEVTKLRSELFAAALAVHEAWLAEAAKSTKNDGHGFGGNIVALTKLLANWAPENPDHALSIWQSLFMMVPVVSTTFASFSNQFRDLGPDSIGWLFIDEAGQAVPQAAVGALWRAKRAMVVGDPLQIEPVFTLPAKLINALSRLSRHTTESDYSPDRTSVQRLADRANIYGINMSLKEGDPPLWIGSPLRVHRRCIEPMFSLANGIAYRDKMIFGLTDRNKSEAPPIHLPSGWIDIQGIADVKQNIPEQTGFVADLIRRLFVRDGKLPESPRLYILSPFKVIRKKIMEKVMSDLADRPLAWASSTSNKTPSASTVRKWMKRHIGTIHTFQGKQADTVLMVLGVGQSNLGAADWAASKPNLLNVALTRAERRFYAVGDLALWRQREYFSDLAKQFELNPYAPEDFLDAIHWDEKWSDAG